MPALNTPAPAKPAPAPHVPDLHAFIAAIEAKDSDEHFVEVMKDVHKH